jgi:putative CocE/NonD family hydrolase
MINKANAIDCGSGVQLERGVAVTMRDGIELVADHYYPPGEGPFPTLLMRQPYGREIASTVVYAHPVWFARAGYHVVIQDVRGRGDSEGDFYPFRNEGADGLDTLTWLVNHPACNGKIGMYGFSYQGITQWLAAAEQPPGLVAIAPWMTAHDLYHGWFYHQGALQLTDTIGWGIQMLRGDARRRQLESVADELEAAWLAVRQQAHFAPYSELPVFEHKGLPSYVRDWIEHRTRDAYWKALDIGDRISAIRIPALHLSGWYDLFLRGSIGGFRALTAAGVPHQYLVAGPWIHIPWGNRVGETSLSVAAHFDTNKLLVRWFNHWLKGTDEFAGEPVVRHFVLGANRWEESDVWAGHQHRDYFLRSDGAANSRKGDGKLTERPADTVEPRDWFVYDPEVPVIAPGGPSAAAGGFDQAGIEQGNNVLVYTSEPLAEDIGVFGSPVLTLFATSSAETTDFVGKLIRVRPDQKCEFICIGIARSGWLLGDTYRADQIQEWRFELEPTSCRFGKGDCIRLEIASSAFPLYDRNPGSDIPPAKASPWNWRRSTQSILHQPGYGSKLELPIRGEE